MIIVTTKSVGHNDSNDNDNCFHYSEPKHKRVAGGGGGGGATDPNAPPLRKSCHLYLYPKI